MKKIVGILILSLFLPLNVFASIKSEVIVENRDLQRGDALSVTIKLHQDSRKDEINILTGIIDFDESLFEKIDEDSFKVLSNWSDFEYDERTHALTVINRYGTILNENVISFQLPLKKDVNPASTSIALKDATVSNEKGDFAIEDTDSNININVSLSDLSGSKNPAPSYGEDLTVSEVKIYYILTILVLELIIAVILLLIYNVAKKKYKSKIQRRNLIIGLCLVEIISCSALFTHNVRKGDLNGDKKITYEDALILARHLVNSEMLSNFKLENADMNKDGKITASDLAILVQLSTEKTPYVAKLTDTENLTLSYEKGTTIDFRFLADVTDDELIEYVMIDGEKYKAERILDSSNEYKVELQGSTVSKNYKYNISEVILANGKTAKVNYEATITVLKDRPAISTFSSKEDLPNSSVKIALTINDEDDAMTSARYELKDRGGKIVETGHLEKGKNSISFKLSNAVAYKLNVKLDYDRGGKSEEHKGSVEDSYDLKIITDYRLKVGDLVLMQNDKETDALEKNGETYLIFSSSNVSGYSPKKVFINDRQYTASGIGNKKYRVRIPNSDLQGGTLKMTKVTLSNGKTILVDQAISYEVLKDVPIVTNLNSMEQSDSIKTSLELLDRDSTISKLILRLYDEDGIQISEKTIEGNEYDVELPTKSTSKYTVKVFADYDRLPGSTYVYKEKLLYEKTIDALLRVSIDEHTVDERYPEKNSIVTLKYDVTSNYKVPIKNIVIDNVIYEAKKVSVNGYEVEMPVGAQAGVKKYNTQKVVLANGMSYDIDREVEIDVLKDYPSIENISIDENTEDRKAKITFDIFDKESSLDSGKIVLKDKETGEITDEKNIIQGKNEVEFTLENARKYDIQVLVDVTLDSGVLEETSPNKEFDHVLYEVEYMIVNDYKLEITSIDTLKDGVKTDYFEKGENISIELSETHLTDYYPIKVEVDGKEYELVKKGEKYTFDIEPFEEAGVKTLHFDSITLSNHKKLVVDCTKKIEILKETPIVEEMTIEDGHITVTLDDKDSALKETKALIMDGEGNELYSGPLTDGNISFDKAENTLYTVKVFASYDLDTNTLEQNSNEYTEVLLFDKMIDEQAIDIDTLEIDTIVLKKKSTDETIGEVTEEDLSSLEDLKIELVFKDGTEKEYEIDKFVIDEKKLTFILHSEEWVKYENKVSNVLKVEYARFVDED